MYWSPPWKYSRDEEKRAAMNPFSRHSSADELLNWERAFYSRAESVASAREGGALSGLYSIVRLTRDTRLLSRWEDPCRLFNDQQHLVPPGHQIIPRAPRALFHLIILLAHVARIYAENERERSAANLSLVLCALMRPPPPRSLFVKCIFIVFPAQRDKFHEIDPQLAGVRHNLYIKCFSI